MYKDISSEIIAQVKMGDQIAFERIYNFYSEKLFRTAFRFLKDSEQSEEVVQQVFINLWLNREKLDPNKNLWVYLYVIGKRLALNQLRTASQSKLFIDNLLVNFEETHNTTEEMVLGRDLEMMAEQIITNLPTQQQLIFRLSRIEGLSHKEIASQLNISTGTVKNHMGAALKAIRARLSDSRLFCFFNFYMIVHLIPQLFYLW